MSGSDGVFRSLSKGFVKDYTDLLAYRTNFTLSKEIFEVRKEFPEEMYSLTDQWKNSQLAVAHSSLIDSDMLVVRALKNSQLTGGDVAIICETVHQLRTSYACEYLAKDPAEKNERTIVGARPRFKWYDRKIICFCHWR